jgi:hypothetical protein
MIDFIGQNDHERSLLNAYHDWVLIAILIEFSNLILTRIAKSIEEAHN